jgi:hypothetical protein
VIKEENYVRSKERERAIYKRGDDVEKCPHVAGIAIIHVANVAHCGNYGSASPFSLRSEYYDW